jgi:hypothetical protein
MAEQHLSRFAVPLFPEPPYSPFSQTKVYRSFVKKVALSSACVADVFSIIVLDLAAAKWRASRTSALACFVVHFPRGMSGCQGQE